MSHIVDLKSFENAFLSTLAEVFFSISKFFFTECIQSSLW